MRIISIVNNKGGVGKTTSAVNLAAGLVASGSLNPDAKDSDKTIRELFPILKG